jgi:hypothetical protein
MFSNGSVKVKVLSHFLAARTSAGRTAAIRGYERNDGVVGIDTNDRRLMAQLAAEVPHRSRCRAWRR